MVQVITLPGGQTKEIGLSPGQTGGYVEGSYLERPSNVNPSTAYIPGKTATEVKVERDASGRPISFNLYRYDQFGNLMSIGEQRAGRGNQIRETPPSRITQEQIARYNAFQEKEYQQDIALAQQRQQAEIRRASSMDKLRQQFSSNRMFTPTGRLLQPAKRYPSTPIQKQTPPGYGYTLYKPYLQARNISTNAQTRLESIVEKVPESRVTQRPTKEFIKGVGSFFTGLPEWGMSGLLGWEAAARTEDKKKLPGMFVSGVKILGGGLIESFKKEPEKTAGSLTGMLLTGKALSIKGKTPKPTSTEVMAKVKGIPDIITPKGKPTFIQNIENYGTVWKVTGESNIPFSKYKRYLPIIRTDTREKKEGITPPPGLLPKKQIKYIAGAKAASTLGKIESTYKNPLDFKQIKYIPPAAAPTLESWLKSQRQAVVGGSAAAKTQFKQARMPADIDIDVPNPRKAFLQVSTILKKQKIKGMGAEINKKFNQYTITFGGHHAIQFLPKTQKGSIIGQHTGLPWVSKKPVKIGGIAYKPSTELIQRKADSILRQYGRTISPPAHRLKDISDFEAMSKEIITQQQAKAQKRGIINRIINYPTEWKVKKAAQDIQTYKLHAGYNIYPTVKGIKKNYLPLAIFPYRAKTPYSTSHRPTNAYTPTIKIPSYPQIEYPKPKRTPPYRTIYPGVPIYPGYTPQRTPGKYPPPQKTTKYPPPLIPKWYPYPENQRKIKFKMPYIDMPIFRGYTKKERTREKTIKTTMLTLESLFGGKARYI